MLGRGHFCDTVVCGLREQLHEGVKKAGLMGFCDPCPGESKQLKVAYSYLGHLYEVRGWWLGGVR